MSDQTTPRQRYAVNIYEPKDGSGSLVFRFVPKGACPDRHRRESPTPVSPEYIVEVRGNGSGISLDWKGTKDDPGTAKSEIEKNVQKRMAQRTDWLNLVSELVGQVDRWGKELGWSTRRIDKRLEDSRIGKHTVTALLMAEETVRVLLEPVSRSVPGGEGLVELSLMPAYDDIASLYYREGGWHLHYPFPNADSVATVRSGQSKPLSKESLKEVLEEMKKHG